MKSTKGILILFLAFMLVSCNSQKKLASEFITMPADIHILLLPPSFIIKDFYPAHPDSLQYIPIDPSWLAKSQFVQHASDSVLVNLFMTSLRENLEAFDVIVYGPEDLESFFELDTTAYIFSVAQLEVLEYVNEEIRYAALDTVIYEVSFAQTNLTHSQWFEFTELNHSERPMQVLYSSQFTSDVFDGRFRQNFLSGEMFYEFQPYRLGFADLYQLSIFAGRKNAQFIFDFLLNKYVADNLKKVSKPLDYLQYDRERHSIRRAYNDRFIRIAVPNSD